MTKWGLPQTARLFGIQKPVIVIRCIHSIHGENRVTSQ